MSFQSEILEAWYKFTVLLISGLISSCSCILLISPKFSFLDYVFTSHEILAEVCSSLQLYLFSVSAISYSSGKIDLQSLLKHQSNFVSVKASPFATLPALVLPSNATKSYHLPDQAYRWSERSMNLPLQLSIWPTCIIFIHGNSFACSILGDSKSYPKLP